MWVGGWHAYVNISGLVNDKQMSTNWTDDWQADEINKFDWITVKVTRCNVYSLEQ